jgi:hypothetical protein
MRIKPRLTSMGVLEGVMWSGAAGALVAFWLFWPTVSDKPLPKRSGAESGTTPVMSFSPPAQKPEGRAFEQWRERFRRSTVPVSLTAKTEEGSGSDWPTVTGSSSLVRSASEAVSPGGTNGPLGQFSGPERIVTARGSGASIKTAGLNEHGGQKIDPVVVTEAARVTEHDPEPSQNVRSDLPVALDDSTPLVAADPPSLGPALDEPRIIPPPEPEPSLNIVGLRQPDVAVGTTEFMNMDVENASAAVDIAAETRAVVEAEPPHVTVPEVDPPHVRVAAAEPPQVTVPEVELVLIDVPADETVNQDSKHRGTEVATPNSETPSRLWPADRDVLVQRGEELLGRGDVGGARLAFQRAAESGNARAAMGMARTFDPKVLRTLRVYGVRPDADQAAQWYARSKTLETVAAMR